MKIKQTLTSLLLLFTLLTYSQFTPILENVKYLTQTIPNCSTINLSSGIYHDISLDVKVERPYYSGDPNQNATGNLILAYSTGSAEIRITTYPIDPSSWLISGGTAFVSKPKSFTLNSNNLDNQNSGQLYARYEANNGFKKESCVNNITKPKFILSPSSVNISCGSTGQTFTVTNENSSPGNLSYEWQVGSGWLYNSNAVSNFTTSTNTVTLVPTSFPPSNVQVTPVLDNHTYSQLTSIINLSDFNPSYSISGNNSICEPSSSGVYSIANLPSGLTITWSSSNTAIATVSSTTGSSTTVNKVSNGTFNLIARVTNSCNQYVDVPISIRIGGVPQIRVVLENNPNLYDTANFYLEGVNSNLNEQRINSIVWERVPPINGAYLFRVQDGDISGSAQGPGNNWSFEAKVTVTNDCGSSVYYFTVTPPPPGPCDTSLRFTQNPMKSGNANRIIIDPCNNSKINNSQLKSYTISIFNYSGKKIYNKSQQETGFDISELKKGLYIVRFKTKNGNILSKNLIIE